MEQQPSALIDSSRRRPQQQLEAIEAKAQTSGKGSARITTRKNANTKVQDKAGDATSSRDDKME